MDSLGGMVLAGGLFLIVVVAGAWMWLQTDEPTDISYTASLPPMDATVADSTSPPDGAATTPQDTTEAPTEVSDILRRAGEARGAGRYLGAKGTGALDLYLAVLAKDPYNKEGLDGLDLTLDAMAKKADAALARYDMEEAERYIAAISVARPDYGVLVGLHDRLELAKSVKTLATKATRELGEGKLVEPPGDNAAETFRMVLAYDPDHRAAKRGMHKIALGLWSRAERAMATKDRSRAQELLLQITAVEPGFSKLPTLAKAISSMRDGLSLEALLDLADDAYAKGRLAPPDDDNAYEIYRRILRDHPRNAEANRGIERVRDRLLTGTRRALDDHDVAEATSWLERALAADADARSVAQLSDEIAYRRRLERARDGIFAKVLSLSDVNATRRVQPKYPRTDVPEGWVDVEFTVTEKGRVKDAVIRDSSVKDVFDDAALSALRRWRFEPVRDSGGPIPVRVGFRFTFRNQG